MRGLDPTDAHPRAVARDDQRVTGAHASTRERSRDHDSRAARGEHAVDPQPWPVAVDDRRRRGERVVEGAAQVVETAPCHGVTRDNRDVTPRRTREPGAHLRARCIEFCVVDRVGVGERDNSVAHTEQLQNDEVLLALGHPTFTRRHDEHGDVDRADACEHVLEELHVPGHVDETDLGPRRQGCEREPEIDRQSARLLFREPVGVGAREREDE